MTEVKTAPVPRPIALNLSGGIALGAFMAGVCFELVRQARKDNSLLLIDIITGASAGAMTGAIGTYYLLNREITDAEYEQNNLFYQAWVERADMKDIDSVLAVQDYQEQIKTLFGSYNPSVLSQKAIENIANLIKENSEKLKVHQPLALVMTVTNLQGLLVDYQKDECNTAVSLADSQNESNPPLRDVKAVTHAETRRFLFHAELNNQPGIIPSMWEKVVKTSLISGAFPVAFPPFQDASSVNSYNLINLSNCYFEPSYLPDKKVNSALPLPMRCSHENGEKLNFWYSDGGILDNLPILKAIDLEASIHLNVPSITNCISPNDLQIQENFATFSQQFKQQNKAPRSNRNYVYVSPYSLQDLKSKPSLKKNNFSLLDLLVSGLKIPKIEQEAIQLQRILQIREQVKHKKEILKLLNELSGDQAQVLALKDNLEKAIPYSRIKLEPIDPLILNRISEIKVNSEAQAQLEELYQTFLDLFKKKLTHKPTSADELLASDFLNAFGGFFDKKYREQDFILGRLCGLTWLHLNFRDIDTANSIESLNKLLYSGQVKFDNPKTKDLKLSYRFRLIRILVRSLRMFTAQTTPKHEQKLIIGLFKIGLIPFFLLIESGLTFCLVSAETIETLLEKFKRK